MKQNMLSHEGFEALVQFDTQVMSIVGEVIHLDGVESFTAHSAIYVDEEFKSAVRRIQDRQRLKAELIEQLVSLPELIQGGEAKILIDMSHSEKKVGMIIKMMLAEADGAGFTVQELSGTSSVTDKPNKI